jgi:hypothetical protein
LVLDQEQEKKQEHQDTTRPAPLPFPPVPVRSRREKNKHARALRPTPERNNVRYQPSHAVWLFYLFYGPAEYFSKPSRRASRRTRRAERDHRITQPFILFFFYRPLTVQSLLKFYRPRLRLKRILVALDTRVDCGREKRLSPLVVLLS